MQLIAHRGFAALQPENTLAAFAFAAATKSCHGVELDVRLTADNQLVVHHDASLDPAFCQDSAGYFVETGVRISSLTYPQLQLYQLGRLNPAYRQHYSYANRPDFSAAANLSIPLLSIPLLTDVLALLAASRPGFTVIIELKQPVLSSGQQHWPALLKALHAAVQPYTAVLTLALCGFDWRLLAAAASYMPALARLYTSHPLSLLGAEPVNAELARQAGGRYYQKLQQAVADGPVPWWQGLHIKRGQSWPAQLAGQIKQLGGAAWFCHYSDVTHEVLAACRAAGLQLAVWGGNEPELAAMAAHGLAAVDYFCTDYPF